MCEPPPEGGRGLPRSGGSAASAASAPTGGRGAGAIFPKGEGFRAWPRKRRRLLGGAGRLRRAAVLPGSQGPAPPSLARSLSGPGPPLIRAGWSQQSWWQTKGGKQNRRKENAGRNERVFATAARSGLNLKVLGARARQIFRLASLLGEDTVFETFCLRHNAGNRGNTEMYYTYTLACRFSLAFKKIPGDPFRRWGGINQTAVMLHSGSFSVGLPTLKVCILL